MDSPSGPPATSPDDITLARAKTRYFNLRRRYWRFLFGAIAVFFVLGTPLFLFPDLPRRVGNLLLGLLFLGFLPCWFGSFVTGWSLTRWRCPLCGRGFLFCKHLGISPGKVEGPPKP